MGVVWGSERDQQDCAVLSVKGWGASRCTIRRRGLLDYLVAAFLGFARNFVISAFRQRSMPFVDLPYLYT